MNRILLASLVAAFALNSIACAHTVTVQTTDPGAEIFVDGRPIGTSPATFSEQVGLDRSVAITARKNGQETTQVVQTSEYNMPAVLSLNAVSAGILLFTGGTGFCISGGLSLSSIFVSKQLPDVVTINNGQPRRSAYREEARPEEEPIAMPAVRRGYGY